MPAYTVQSFEDRRSREHLRQGAEGAKVRDLAGERGGADGAHRLTVVTLRAMSESNAVEITAKRVEELLSDSPGTGPAE